jgi:hypothetical protein
MLVKLDKWFRNKEVTEEFSFPSYYDRDFQYQFENHILYVNHEIQISLNNTKK